MFATTALRIQRYLRGPRPLAISTFYYFLLNGGSSMNWTQYPVGLTFEAVLMTLIFMGVSVG